MLPAARSSMQPAEHSQHVPDRLEAHRLTFLQLPQVAADGDDIEVASTTVSLRCPMTGGRVGRAGRFQGIDALEAFDMDAFLSMAARTRKWQCPHTMRHTCVQQLHNDAFIQGILDRLQVCWLPGKPRSMDRVLRNACCTAALTCASPGCSGQAETGIP